MRIHPSERSFVLYQAGTADTTDVWYDCDYSCSGTALECSIVERRGVVILCMVHGMGSSERAWPLLQIYTYIDRQIASS